MYYLEAHIRLNNPDRRSSSAKLAAQRRQLRATVPGQVHAIICPQLEDAQVRDLDRAYTFVGGLFQRGVLPNDLDWLEQTGSADGGQTNGLLHFASLYALLPLLDDEGTWVEAFALCGGDAAGAGAADSGANVTVADFAFAFIDF
eukprot:s5248_g8.t1